MKRSAPWPSQTDDPYVEQLIERCLDPQGALGCPGASCATTPVWARCCSPRSSRSRSWRRPSAPCRRSGRSRLIAVYALTQRVQFDVGAGYTVPSQLVFMPMLLLAPPALVPLLVAASFLVGRLPSYLRGAVHPTRLVFVLADAVYAVGPAVVVALLAPDRIGLDDWPVLALALVALAVCDCGVTVVRDKLAHGIPPNVALRLFVWVFAVDAALTPVGRPGRRRR